MCATLFIGFCGQASAQSAGEFYNNEVASHIVPCLACHTPGGVAASRGARLIFAADGASGQNSKNLQALESFYALPDVDAALVFAKISGGASHGGGRVHAAGSTGYKAIQTLLQRLDGQITGGGGGDDFWQGLLREPRDRTLRRAAILLAGKIPAAAQFKTAKKDDAQLRKQLLKLMKGDEFHKFILVGANDRLHTDAFLDGMTFEFDGVGYYPMFNKFYADMPSDCLDSNDAAENFATLDRCKADQAFRYGVIKAPLELIAKVIEANQSYKKILTSRFTMVNNFSSLAFRANKFPKPSTAPGAFDPVDALIFKKAANKGQILHKNGYENDSCSDGFCKIIKHGAYIKQPHAGVLTSPAFLARYPTTDTNRNRARARWTFYHFLGIDIEKSAPRTTDPAALADTNNPTLNNSNCTVCHLRMDPVAGAFQNFGDFGVFRERWGGMDSLAEAYKNPEYYGGEVGDTLYQRGDTWYRDMLKPGLGGDTTAKKKGSLAWLAGRIVADPRFAKATVAFWWPSIMGVEVLEAPEVESDPDYQQKLNAYNAQQVLMDSLAEKFRKKNYRAKELFADMIMSDWYRAEGFEGNLSGRMIELATVGSGRLLTPEELDRKAYAVFGVRWNQDDNNPWSPGVWTQLGQGDERIAFGGIDSVGVLERSRFMTALMSNVAERQAVEFACRVTIYDFNRADVNANRKLCVEDLWYETDRDKLNCPLAMPENRPALFKSVTKNDVPNSAGKAKLEKQLIVLYTSVLGRPLSKSDPEFAELYTLLVENWQDHRDRGYAENSCYLGSEQINSIAWDAQQYDPNGMVAAWSSVMRALMTHYWYLHD
jgi:hypothetical protein